VEQVRQDLQEVLDVRDQLVMPPLVPLATLELLEPLASSTVALALYTARSPVREAPHTSLRVTVGTWPRRSADPHMCALPPNLTSTILAAIILRYAN